jgi:DNA repair protein SbcD/Mre11
VNPSAQAEELFYDAIDRLAAGGTRGLVIIAGNHDNPERISAPAPLADRLGITLIGLPKDRISPTTASNSGRVRRVQAGPSWVELQLPTCEESAVIAALPYPSEARLKELLTETLDESDMVRSYSERIQALFADLASHYRPDTVNLAMSHLFVRGGIESDSETQIQVGGTYAVDASAFPATAQYVALGHLHRPQSVPAAPVPTRYAGSPLAYSFSEVGYTKSVVIVDASPAEPVRIREIPLRSGKPLVKWTATQGIPQVVRWVNEGKDMNAWIDVEIYLQDGLSIEDTHMLRSIHPGFVHIRPVFSEQEKLVSPEEIKNLPLDQLFIRFFERQKGFAPDDALIQTFLELAEQTEIRDDEDAAEEVAG